MSDGSQGQTPEIGAGSRWPWCLSAALLLAGLGTMAVLSSRLSPLVAPTDRPLLIYVLCYALSCGGFAWAYWLATRRNAATPVLLIVVVALLARILFLPSHLIQSDDCYRYVLDGQTLLAGINPYRFSPAEIRDDPPLELIADHPNRATHIISHVNNPHVPTIYPPLALAVFAAGATLAPWDILGQRVALMLCDIACAALLAGLLKKHRKPLGWIVVYAWNPLVIKEISNTAHIDSLAGLWLVLLVALLIRPGTPSPPRIHRDLIWAALVGVAAAGAILAKLYPLVLLPIAAIGVARKSQRVWAGVVTVAITGILTTLCYWPFLSIGFERVIAGLQTYRQHWINNPGAFAVLAQLLEQPRTAYHVLVAVVALLAGMIVWVRSAAPEAVVAAMQAALLAWLLLAPACFPWYAVGILAISVLRPRSWAVGLTATFGLFYLLRHAEYHDWPAAGRVAIQAVEHGIIWVWLAAGSIPGLLQ